MFESVRFRNFKSLKDYTVHLRTMNVLVGPNNAGKSTILDAFRAMAAAHRYARRRTQSPISIGGTTVVGYEIPMTNFPISLASVLVVKDLKLKGSSSVVKGGTKVRNIRLTEASDGHNIACKIDGIGAMNLKSEFVKKA